MMLDIRLDTFLAVCRHMNFTRAAAALNLTQPAVSQHIRFLEQHYGAKLFRYQGRKLTLTREGEYLKAMAETLSHDAGRIRENMALAGQRERLYLGATLSIGEFLLPKKLGAFLRSHEEMNISLTVADTAALLPLLDAGKLDAVLCEGYFNKNEYDHMLIRRERMCIFAAAGYDTSRIRSLPDLFGEPLLTREEGSGTREIFERYLWENNYSLENFCRIHTFSSPHLILQMLLEGLGISVLYRTVGEAQLRAGTLQELRLPGFDISHEFNAIWKKGSVFGARYEKLLRALTGEAAHSPEDIA